MPGDFSRRATRIQRDATFEVQPELWAYSTRWQHQIFASRQIYELGIARASDVVILKYRTYCISAMDIQVCSPLLRLVGLFLALHLNLRSSLPMALSWNGTSQGISRSKTSGASQDRERMSRFVLVMASLPNVFFSETSIVN